MIFSFVVLVMFILGIIHTDIVYLSSLDSVTNFFKVIFPSLFFMFMMFDLIFMTKLPLKLTKIFHPLFSKLFRFNHEKSSYLFLTSLIVSQPTISKLVNDSYQNNEIDKIEANHILKFNSFFSIVSSIAIINLLFSDIKLKILFIFTNYITNITLGIIVSRFYLNNSEQLLMKIDNNVNLINNISKSITKNINVLLWVLGFVVFFDVILNILLFYLPLSYYNHLFFLLIFDQTKGMTFLIQSILQDQQIIKLLLFFIPLLGIATFVEIKMLFNEANMSSFILFRILASFISIGLFLLLYIVII